MKNYVRILKDWRVYLAVLLDKGGSVYLKFAVLIPLAVVQLTVLPTLLPSLIVCDLVVLWLILNAVFLRFPQTLAIACVLALLVETHSVVPQGLYFCGYWVLIISIYLLKGSVTWNVKTAWFAVVIIGKIWLLFLECMVVDLSQINLAVHIGRGVVQLAGTCLVLAVISPESLKNLKVSPPQ